MSCLALSHSGNKIAWNSMSFYGLKLNYKLWFKKKKKKKSWSFNLLNLAHLGIKHIYNFIFLNFHNFIILIILMALLIPCPETNCLQKIWNIHKKFLRVNLKKTHFNKVLSWGVRETNTLRQTSELPEIFSLLEIIES